MSELRVRLQECVKQLDESTVAMAIAQEVMLDQATEIKALKHNIAVALNNIKVTCEYADCIDLVDVTDAKMVDGELHIAIRALSVAQPVEQTRALTAPIAIKTDQISEIAGKYNLGHPRLDALRGFVNEVIIVNEAEYAKSE